jgi:hypothetical protein
MGYFSEKAIFQHDQERTAVEECPQCRHPMYRGYCYYCGTGKRQPKTEEQRQEDEFNALRLWNSAAPIANTMVERYLRNRCISILPPNVDDVLRFHSDCPFGGGQRVPVMLGLIRDVGTDQRPCGVHRTPINHRNCAKLGPAKVLGTYQHTAIKLWPGPINKRLTIGEGIETVLSAIELMPELAPAWAVGTAYNIGMFPILDDVDELHILADNDPKENGRIGQAKAKQCAGRYSAFAKAAETHTPKRHNDFNDILRELRHARS